MTKVVTFTEEEIVECYIVGGKRQAYNLAHGKTPRWGKNNDMWGRHVVGALGEKALSKATGLEWTGKPLGSNRLPDVGGKYQSRATTYASGPLLLYDWDEDHADLRYYLAIIDCMKATIIGWMIGRAGMKDRWRSHDDACWKVPPGILLPYED
jgi:hypothetical protein